MRHRSFLLALSSLLAGACEIEASGPFDHAVQALSTELGEPVLVDQCREQLGATGAQVCTAHLESGFPFELEVVRSAGRLDLRARGMAAGREAARKLSSAYQARGLELPDMHCPALIPVGDGRPVTCTGTIRGVPVEANVTAADGRFNFVLERGVIHGADLARAVARHQLGDQPGDVGCGFDLRLSVPGVAIPCRVTPRDGSEPHVVWVRIENTEGRVAMSSRPPGS